MCLKATIQHYLRSTLDRRLRGHLHRRSPVAQLLEASYRHHHPSPAAAGEYARLAKRLVANRWLGCLAYALLILHAHERIVHIAAQYRPCRAGNRAEHAQQVLVLVLVIRDAPAAYQHAAAAAACPQVLRVGRPRSAGEVAALLHQLASPARNAAGVPAPCVVGDVLRPAAVAIRTVCVLVGKRATDVMAKRTGMKSNLNSILFRLWRDS